MSEETRSELSSSSFLGEVQVCSGNPLELGHTMSIPRVARKGDHLENIWVEQLSISMGNKQATVVRIDVCYDGCLIEYLKTYDGC